MSENGGAEEPDALTTEIPGIVVETRLADADTDTLEAVHRRQLEWALDHAGEATDSTRP